MAWLTPLGSEDDAASDPAAPVLCRRHADRTTVPAGWTLDDRREPMPRLFRLPPETEVAPTVERVGPVITTGPRPELETPVLPLDELSLGVGCADGAGSTPDADDLSPEPSPADPSVTGASGPAWDEIERAIGGPPTAGRPVAARTVRGSAQS